jgi:hypothetical protein
MSNFGRSFCFLALLLCGCTAGQARRPTDAPGKAALITAEEIRDSRARDAYEIIQFLRPGWLQQSGAYSFRNDGGIAVYLNRMRLPGLEALREIETGAVTYIRHFDAVGAQFTFGISHNHGAIQVVTERAK